MITLIISAIVLAVALYFSLITLEWVLDQVVNPEMFTVAKVQKKKQKQYVIVVILWVIFFILQNL